ncbi:MAG: hypothetical protein RR190_02380 [Bacteroidales bacterium]
MLKKICLCLLLLSSALWGQAQAQGSYVDLTIVESIDYNKPLANFSFENFQNMFKISSAEGDFFDPNITKALIYFIDLLQPERSYIIQHEPTYYFVFQYNKKNLNYLVMNNSIGEKNEAIYVNTFTDAQKQMLILLHAFYNNMPTFSVKEYK